MTDGNVSTIAKVIQDGQASVGIELGSTRIKAVLIDADNTPVALARRGVCFDFVWSNAPVCASARTTLWAGIYGSSTGGEHVRSMVPFPEDKKMFLELLREAGYSHEHLPEKNSWQ